MKEAREEAKKTETKSAVGRGDLTCKGFEAVCAWSFCGRPSRLIYLNG